MQAGTVPSAARPCTCRRQRRWDESIHTTTPVSSATAVQRQSPLPGECGPQGEYYLRVGASTYQYQQPCQVGSKVEEHRKPDFEVTGSHKRVWRGGADGPLPRGHYFGGLLAHPTLV